MFEGSHIQTAGMMNHREYSNYTSFLEVELAVMQDLGYDIDRKAYFGKSIYGNGKTITNTQGYSARNEDGTAYTNEYNEVPLGIGLHIYGANNTVTQAANILTKGDGAAGIRVDGSENTVNIAKDTKIHADGYRGNGIMVAYGRKQTINQEGTVTASGEGGVGARFDFGSSSNGAADEYRGSYIRYARSVDESGGIKTASNESIVEMGVDDYNANSDELNGALVKEYNISGTLEGKENAVYIGKNAFVEDINVNEDANISGNITNDWKHFEDAGYNSTGEDKTPLKIQYNNRYGENGYAHDAYIPDLVTNINFNADNAYSGDITGKDNTKVNVNKGTLVYGGKADVVGVKVAENAALYGGEYTVNNMTDKMAEGFSDTETGQVINHGTIGAVDKDSALKITGELTSDAKIQVIAGGDKGNIEVTGKANVEGSSLEAQNFVPDESKIAVSTTEGVSGNVKTSKVSALMNAEGVIDGNNLVVKTTEANNLENPTAEQTEILQYMNQMRQTMQANNDSAGVDEMRTLYNMDSTSAKSALTGIGAGSVADLTAIVQRNGVSGEIINDRLSTAFEIKENDNVNHNLWIKFGKHWGDTRSGVDYHGNTIAGGYHWIGARTLKECFKNIPPELDAYVSDYKINVFEIAWLDDETVTKFKSDFRYVADYYVQMRKTGKWQPMPGNVKHLKELLDLFSAVTKDNRFMEMYQKSKGAVNDMSCVALDYLKADLAKEYKAELAKEYKAEVKDSTTLDHIRNIMINLNCSIQQAMETLSVPKEDRQRYMDKI